VATYVDTSALAKWYLNEAFSEEVEAFLASVLPASISPLVKLEMRSLLARRRREGSVEPALENRILAVFENDVVSGHLSLLPARAEHFPLAETLIGALPGIPLRTLDALHLAIAKAEGVDLLATADIVMMHAAEHLGIPCRYFGVLP